MLKTSKILIAILAAAMCSLSLVSCGGKTEKTETAAADSADVRGTAAPAKAEALVEGLPTVIDFYATWCGPCKNIAPVFDMLKGKYAGKVNFVSVDVDVELETASRYHIDAMPTFVFLDAEGNEVHRMVGADPTSLTQAVEKLASGV